MNLSPPCTKRVILPLGTIYVHMLFLMESVKIGECEDAGCELEQPG